MKKVWRLENEGGQGVYWSNIGNKYLQIDNRHPFIPIKVVDKYLGYPGDQPHFVFAFPSRKAVRRWFSPHELTLIRKKGEIKLRCYRVTKILWTDKAQLIFDKRSAKRIS